MNLPAFSVARPVLTVMVTLIAVLLGVISLARLPIDLLPDIAYPTLTVSVDYPNASPEEMEELVARPLEQAVAAVPGVEEVLSSSAEGLTNVTLRFGWGSDLDVASNDVRDRLERILDTLPDEATRPRLRKFDTADVPIMLVGAASRIDPITLRTLVDDQLTYRLQQVPGVAAVDVYGGPEREIQVNVDPDRARALALSLLEIRDAVRAANLNLPGGSIELGNQELTIRTPGRLTDLDTLRDTVVAKRDDAPVTLDQVADVADAQRRVTRIIRIDGEPGIRMAVRKQSDANTVEVARRLRAEIERLNADFPQVRLSPLFDNSDYIERSIANVTGSILYGGALAVLVLLLFLGNVRATAVIATAIPVSLIASFTLIHFAGFTLNLMTLGGLALGVGLMVDSAIVVMENILRRRDELGETAAAAAERGAVEMAAPIVASTLTTLAIFVPMLYARELAGQLFQQLAFVVAFALACALLVALTLVPTLAAHGVRATRAASRPALAAPLARARQAYEAVQTRYRGGLDASLAHPRKTLALSLAAFAAALAMLPFLGTEFMPPSDEGEVRVELELPPGTRLDVVDRQLRRVEAVVAERVPEAVSTVSDVGASGYRPSQSARADLRIALPPIAERERSSAEVADDLRRAIGPLPDTEVRVRLQQPFFMRALTGGQSEELQIEVRGFDLGTLEALARQIERDIGGIRGITDVRLSQDEGQPQQLIEIDRRRAADLGVTVESIARTVETAIGGTTAGQYLEHGDEVRILVRLADSENLPPAALLELQAPDAAGGLVRLGNVATLASGRGPTVIDRKNQQRQAVVYANVSDRDLGSVVADVREALQRIPRPDGYATVIGGNYEEQEAAFGELGLNLLLALLLVYMVMACLYESLRDPLIVMFSVPLALIGVAAMLGLTGTTLNAQSLIGCVMLIGIVVNNAILIVDQANRLRRHEGLDTAAALHEAGRRRLRPILMTSLTTMLALVPLALGIGEGADTQAPLARAVIGGLLSATFITLLVIPVIYAGFHRAWPAARP